MSERPKPIEITEPVALTINGRAVTAQKGDLLIDAAERAGTYIPRFCYHPRMHPVGMCRMCLVEVDTGRGPALQPSCMLECADGMVVNTESDKVVKAQEGVLEFLLINHPLDCPVCDKGGECPLQDATIGFGPGESRFVEEKRHKEKPIPLSATVNLDRERCILCDRCTRFADEVAGDSLIHFMNRGNNTEVNTFPGHPFASYYSGNTVQICPVGALTSIPYRFEARPWDLESVGSTCTSCAMGCQVAVESSRDRLTRVQGVDSDAVNWSWLCDKGRYGFDAFANEQRLRAPLVRSGDSVREVHWNDALDRAAELIRHGLDVGGPGGLAMIGGAHGSNEAAYAWAKLLKSVIGTDNVDAQLGDGVSADAVVGLPRVSLNQALTPGSTVVYLGPDPKEELPVLYLRLRHATRHGGVKLIVMTPRVSSLDDIATVSVQYRPGALGTCARAIAAGIDAGDAGDPSAIAAARKVLADATGHVTAMFGRATLAESDLTVRDALSVLREAIPTARYLPVLRRGNVHGAIDLGLAPGLLPGRVELDDGTAWFDAAWGHVPATVGLDATHIMVACAEGKIDTLVLVGADPLNDMPDRSLAERALAGARSVISVDLFHNDSNRNADVVLPVTAFGEFDGTTTNFEGRVTRLTAKVSPPVGTRDEWSVVQDLACRLGADWQWSTAQDVWGEVVEISDLYHDASWAQLSLTAEGVFLGADEPGDEGPSEPGEPEDSDTDELIPAPPRTVFASTPPVAVPAVDAYAVRLVVSRRLYDSGVVTTASPTNAALGQDACLLLNPTDFARVGIGDRERVRAVAGDRSLTLPAAADSRVPTGVAWVQWGDVNCAVGSLIDHSAIVNDVRLEVVS